MFEIVRKFMIDSQKKYIFNIISKESWSFQNFNDTLGNSFVFMKNSIEKFLKKKSVYI